jgi:hypothetical protein
MDTATILIGVAIALLCAAPVIFFTNTDKKTSSKLLKFIRKEAAKQQYNIAEPEQSGDFALALDEKQKVLLFAKKLKYDYVFQSIGLKDYTECRVVRTDRLSHNKNTHSEGIQKIELRFTNKDKNKASLTLEFFNADENPSIQDELKLAEKWSVIINKLLISTVNQKSEKIRETELNIV